MDRLKGQTAVVTGSSAGIGQAIAIGMAAEGASVCITYHSHPEGAEDTLKQVEQAGGKGIIVSVDVSDAETVDEMFAQTVRAFGTVDILVANAGVQKDAAFLEMTVEDWKTAVDTDLTGQFLCAQAAAKEFVRRGSVNERSRALGKIICMSSVHDVIPWAGHVNYATAKGGVMMFMKSLAQELGEKKIRVNGIAPGAIKTKINESVWGHQDSLENLLKLVPYGRIGEPEDIAKACVWLASDDSDYVHGTMLYVDGGMTLYPGFLHNG